MMSNKSSILSIGVLLLVGWFALGSKKLQPIFDTVVFYDETAGNGYNSDNPIA